ncbi:MAG: site-specific DNA-methyltransferase [Burkholderiales bacterium]|uniref:DNA methyltransferase n=1 Tax=Limnobacter sp. TaxID=2003368 RepID=UPI0039420136|nr:site-specific DNA-methyltransferase [Burkholderiales bacterium]
MKRISFDKLNIVNPKQRNGHATLDDRLFPYYAGYSKKFTELLLRSMPLDRETTILDPWNGSGTTTDIAANLGLRGIGVDLNPVMVVAAKASHVSPNDACSLIPLAQTLIKHAEQRTDELENDPLYQWLMPSSARYIRQLEAEVSHTLISNSAYLPLITRDTLNQLSALAAFFYVALFRITRRLLNDFIPTNPTWVKIPSSLRQRKRPSNLFISQLFIEEVRCLAEQLLCKNLARSDVSSNIAIGLGNAEDLSCESLSVDTIVSSPPYCTRIDYAVATAIELAVLRVDESLFNRLRRSLMGTSTVESSIGQIDKNWGGTCERFLDAMRQHASKSSATYYFKNHFQYFSALYNSIGELTRVLKKNGSCFLVIQDSYYKDLHNNVPLIASEMAANHGLSLKRKVDFSSTRSMADVHPHAKKYAAKRNLAESVLCFEKA